ncbi:MAG: enoyl-CoA hydratase/isomerase family protein [Acidobacteriia bacterium]|nr:enoyl-CoA hydratase/isomerase family protein [Terriglobia bacterium]
MSDVLQTHHDGRLLRIALNRPEKRNALNVQLCRELVHTLERAEQDPSVGAILLTGNGKCFCAGMDLSEVASGDTGEITAIQEQLFTIGSRLGKPLVAAVQNAALAGGTGLAANCHIVMAREDAVFGLTEIRLGLWPFVVFRSVSAAVGERRAVELALTGRIFGASEAKEMGLVHEVTPHLEGRATELALALAESSPTALRSGLTFVQEVRGRDWKTAGEIARRIRDEVFESKDFREGLQAFLEKRAPRWPSLSSTR